MKILITGATGFIGSHLVKQLLQDNHTLFCTLLKGETNPFGEDKVESIIFSDHSLDENVSFVKRNNVEGVIHLASFVQSGEHKPSDVEALIDTNIKFSTTLLEVAAIAKVKWFLNTGTFWQHYKNEDYSPVNLYAATKQAFENIAKYYYETNNIMFCTLRLFDTYGKNDTRNKIFNLWNKISKTREVLDMSPGEQIMDFSYIDDIVDAYVLLTDYLHNKSTKVKNGDVFYLQSSERYSLKELSKIFEEVTSLKLNINWGGRPYKDREVMEPISSNKTLPEFKHKVTIQEGIQKLFD